MIHQFKPYYGLKASLLTQHGKEKVIFPELQQTNELEVFLVQGYDTDKLGTFTREIPRLGSQLDAARKKARIGMELSGARLGVASEGSFNQDPYTGLIPWNYELVLLMDDTRGLEISGFSSSFAQSASKKLSSWDELISFLSEAQFPTHHLILRPDDEYHPNCKKGLDCLDSLKEAFFWAMHQSKTNHVFVENDLRAHTNPTRMANILKATQDLARKMNSLCPACSSPGFWISRTQNGLPCSRCDAPTNLPISNIWSCVKCAHTKEVVIENQTKADPSKCNFCNP